MKDQKGFIQIPLLIIIIASVVIASSGVGVVLHRQGKLSFLTADISGTLEQNEETIAVKDEEAKQEELQNGQESKSEVEPTEEEVTQQEIDESVVVQQERKLAEEPVESEFIPEVEEPQTISVVEEVEVCTNCNISDGCSGDSYLDYYCSGNSCVYNSDDCSDCSCSCGGYNVEESTENANCEDGKDNDCDGLTDLADLGCANKNENCHIGSLWSQGYCTSDCKCKAGEGDCNSGADCETGYCAQGVGERYGQAKWVDACEEIPYLKILSPTEAEEWEKGKTYTIKWEFRGAENLKSSIVLVGAPFGLSTIASDVPLTSGEYRWSIPSKLEAGKLYKIRMYLNGSHNTDYFKIVGKNIPDIRTLPVFEQNLYSDWALLEGEIISLNAASGCTVWFEWGETTSLRQETSASGGFRIGIYPLSANTTYYFRAVMGCDDGVGYGEIKSFTTRSASLPTVDTKGADPGSIYIGNGIYSHHATLFGGIADSGGAKLVEGWFEWGETSSLEQETDHKYRHSISSLGQVTEYRSFEETITELSPSTTYYFRAVAKNHAGVSYGEIKSFTTENK